MGIQAYVFDMDGTLLHTLPDLFASVNQALVEMDFPPRSYDEVLGFMGDGGARLIERAQPLGTSAKVGKQLFDLWREIYIGSDYAHTAPFPGVVEVLQQLRERGIASAVLSNKFHVGTCALAERFFPGLFDVVRGDLPPTPRKPDPTTLLQVLDELGVPACAAAYVGDAAVDYQVARNAGVLAIGVSWGYDAANPLPVGELDAYIHDPHELLGLCDWPAPLKLPDPTKGRRPSV